MLAGARFPRYSLSRRYVVAVWLLEMVSETSQGSVWADAILRGASELLRLFVSPGSRVYWVFLSVSLLVAVVLWLRERSRSAPLPAHLDVFSKQTWLGRSAMNDYWLILTNAMLVGGILDALLPDARELTADTVAILRAGLPDFALEPSFLAGLALAATLFVVDDFARYGLHRLEHQSAILWEFHKIHHSAEVLNFFTAERHHPVSLLYFRAAIAVTGAFVNGVFLYLFGESISPTSLLGANAFWILGNMLASSLRHSPSWLSFGPCIERWLVSPAQHQIHHSDDPKHFGTNFGSTLAIWDRLFGTLFVTTPQRIHLRFGIGPETLSHRSLFRMYLRPFLAVFRNARAAETS